MSLENLYLSFICIANAAGRGRIRFHRASGHHLLAVSIAGEAAGVAGWTAALASGQMDRGDVLLGFSEPLEHQINTAGVIDHGILFV